jgi:hypothetical protein
MDPIMMDVRPVAHAVIVDVIGPVALVRMDIFPPVILIHELGLVKGWGILPSDLISLSACSTASCPPTAELKVIATLGAISGVISIPLFWRAR